MKDWSYLKNRFKWWKFKIKCILSVRINSVHILRCNYFRYVTFFNNPSSTIFMKLNFMYINIFKFCLAIRVYTDTFFILFQHLSISLIGRIDWLLLHFHLIKIIIKSIFLFKNQNRILALFIKCMITVKSRKFQINCP